MSTGVRCPLCREVDWFRDGLVIVEVEDGSVVVDRVEPARHSRDDWSCMACGYEVLSRSKGAHVLDELAVRLYSPVSVPGGPGLRSFRIHRRSPRTDDAQQRDPISTGGRSSEHGDTA